VTGLNLAPLAKRVVDLMQQVLPLASVRDGAGGFIFLLVPLGQAPGQTDGRAVRVYFRHRVAATDDVIGGHDVGGREIECGHWLCGLQFARRQLDHRDDRLDVRLHRIEITDRPGDGFADDEAHLGLDLGTGELGQADGRLGCRLEPAVSEQYC